MAAKRKARRVRRKLVDKWPDEWVVHSTTEKPYFIVPIPRPYGYDNFLGELALLNLLRIPAAKEA